MKVDDLRAIMDSSNSEGICFELQEKLDQAHDLHVPLVDLEEPLKYHRKLKKRKEVIIIFDVF